MEHFIKFSKNGKVIDTHISRHSPEVAVATIYALYPEYVDYDVTVEPYSNQTVVLLDNLDQEIDEINRQMAFVIGDYQYAKDKRDLEAILDAEKRFDALSRKLQLLTAGT